MRDKIFNTPQDPLVKFTFDKQVADVFPDMIERSIPGYTTTIAMIGVLAAQYAQSGSNCYDLGSSLGAVTLAMRRHITSDTKIIAVDNSKAMVERSLKIINRDHSTIPVKVICDDIRNVVIENASVVVINFTLQFLEPLQRNNMVEKIFKGLLPGGIFILSEKIKFSEDAEQINQTNWHHAFKKANGYSDLEIAQKRTALENVLIPETEQVYMERLRNAGFTQIHKWFQCLNFISFVAQK